MERNTKQQQQILEILKESKSHPTIKELCDLIVNILILVKRLFIEQLINLF